MSGRGVDEKGAGVDRRRERGGLLRLSLLLLLLIWVVEGYELELQLKLLSEVPYDFLDLRFDAVADEHVLDVIPGRCGNNDIQAYRCY